MEDNNEAEIKSGEVVSGDLKFGGAITDPSKLKDFKEKEKRTATSIFKEVGPDIVASLSEGLPEELRSHDPGISQ